MTPAQEALDRLNVFHHRSFCNLMKWSSGSSICNCCLDEILATLRQSLPPETRAEGTREGEP